MCSCWSMEWEEGAERHASPFFHSRERLLSLKSGAHFYYYLFFSCLLFLPSCFKSFFTLFFNSFIRFKLWKCICIRFIMRAIWIGYLCRVNGAFISHRPHFHLLSNMRIVTPFPALSQIWCLYFRLLGAVRSRRCGRYSICGMSVFQKENVVVSNSLWEDGKKFRFSGWENFFVLKCLEWVRRI